MKTTKLINGMLTLIACLTLTLSANAQGIVESPRLSMTIEAAQGVPGVWAIMEPGQHAGISVSQELALHRQDGRLFTTRRYFEHNTRQTTASEALCDVRMEAVSVDPVDGYAIDERVLIGWQVRSTSCHNSLDQVGDHLQFAVHLRSGREYVDNDAIIIWDTEDAPANAEEGAIEQLFNSTRATAVTTTTAAATTSLKPRTRITSPPSISVRLRNSTAVDDWKAGRGCPRPRVCAARTLARTLFAPPAGAASPGRAPDSPQQEIFS